MVRSLAHGLARISRGFGSIRRRWDRALPGGDPKVTRLYLEQFPDMARAFQRFLQQCDLAGIQPAGNPSGETVGVVVMPWVATAVPWFSIALGLGLARRSAEVVFIWDDTVFPVPSAELDTENVWIDRVLADLRPHFPVVRLTEEPQQPPRANDEEILETLVKLNLVWALRGDNPTERELSTAQETRAYLGDTLTRIRGLLTRTPYRYLVVPGGIRGTSGLYLHAGRETGTRVATFDSGFGWSIVCPDGAAAQGADVPRAFEALYRAADAEISEAVEAARDEYERRIRGSDRMAYQAARLDPVDGALEDAVLIPLSVEWDAAALGRHHIFQDSAEWLVATVGYLLDHTEAPVIVRQHPSERREHERSRFHIGPLLGHRFGNHPRFRFVSAEEDINTYNLLVGARLVLPYVSTIGIEAAALGKTVIPAGRPYYGALGFTWNADSQAEYFDLIERAMAGTLPPLPDQRRRAWLCFYINAVCYRVFTDFSPQPADFAKWSQWKPEWLFAKPEVEDLVTAIDEDRPVPLLRHARRATRPTTVNGHG